MLSQHPANLLLRFVLEIVALVGVGQWDWQAGASLPGPAWRYVLAFGVPLLMAVLWAVFRIPNDPTQPGGKKPIVTVPGRGRLALELAFFGFAVWAVFTSGRVLLGAALTFAILLHYFWSADRLIRMWRGR